MVGTHLMYEESIDGEMNIMALLGAIYSDLPPDLVMAKLGLLDRPFSRLRCRSKDDPVMIARNEEIVRLRKSGLPYYEIGTRMGIGKDAARKVCLKAGVSK